MGIVGLIIVAMIVLALFGAAKDGGDDSPNWGGLIGLVVVGGLLLATCASCG